MSQSVRVLLVPDYANWILGTWAKRIAEVGKNCEYIIFPEGLIAANQERWDTLVEYADVIHFLSPYVDKYLPKLSHKAVMTSIHHVVNWEIIEHLTHADAVMVVADEWRDYLP